ncbi:NACHT domain-containing protein [Archangium sp.]|uniref:NACHT domain-containing protein n=1 Tax=Archangium sp. TaxID=1872627 RepID=UPI002D3F1E46|nr:NACHT domain-containing protein [Archangium sp.]HYO56754.1 NACHT domain-containing protein [Archangium sp.]
MSQPADRSSAERGRDNNARGIEFEVRVAECYRVLHYRVETRRLFGGREVDLFLTRVLGDLTIHRAIECKAGPVTVDHLDSFLAKLNLVRREYPSSLGTIVSGSSFTAAVASHAAQSGIQLITYRELSAQILDGHPYVNQLLREQNSNERYRPERFVEPRICYDTTSVGVPAFRIIDEWLNDEAMRQLTLLGDVGTGKTFLSRMIANRLGEEFLAEPMDKPLPLLVDLRHADRQFSLEGILSWHFAQTGLEQVTFRVFQHALSEGRIVLLLDGFDEMAAKVNDQITIRNFHELSRCVQGRAKVLLTCRTHYFRSRAEEESVILGRASEDEADIARGLYWDLVTRRGFQIAYVRPFDLLQVEDFVAKANPTSTKKTLEKIRSTYNLHSAGRRANFPPFCSPLFIGQTLPSTVLDC